MHYCIVELHSQTATFRNPEFQNYHKTFDLPPPTTAIGILGAALGLSAMKAQEFFDENITQLGIAGYSAGKAQDLWKYANMQKYSYCYEPGINGGVITREVLFGNVCYFVFGTASEKCLAQIEAAFHSPKYALTLGSSDSLAFIKSIETRDKTNKGRKIKHCVAQGDLVGKVLEKAAEDFEFSIYENSDSITYNIPIAFDYAEEYGRRTVSKVGTFSFVSHSMKLNFELEGIEVNDLFIPLLNF